MLFSNTVTIRHTTDSRQVRHDRCNRGHIKRFPARKTPLDSLKVPQFGSLAQPPGVKFHVMIRQFLER